jgi:spermidine synthase
MPRWLAATRPGSNSLVLEIDSRLVALAREELGLVTGPELAVRTGDARTELDGVADGSHDIVLGDAFGGLAVPWHLTTREFASEVRRVLRPGGIYVLNVIDHPPLRFARAELATLDAVFDHVAVLAPGDVIEGSTGGNVVLVAGDRPLPLDRLAANIAGRGGIERVAAGGDARAFAAGAPVLTDDRAPVDQWLARSRRARPGV